MDSILDHPVLVLNRLWQAVNTCTVRRAFALLYQGHAHVVNHDPSDRFTTHDLQSWADFSRRYPEEQMVQGVSIRVRIPRIIVLLLFDRLPKKEIKFTRQNVYERDQYTCQYCGKVCDPEELNLDHVIPRDKGGLTTWENVVCSCISCNTRKANRLPHQAGMKLIRAPRKPKWRPFVHLSPNSSIHESWKHFIDVTYWNVELSS